MKNLVFLFLVCISSHAFSQDLMTEKKFTQYLQEEVSNSDEKLKILVFDDLVLGSKFNNASFLHNLKSDYSRYQSAPSKLKPIVEEIKSRIDSLYAADPSYEIDTTKIVPILKPKKFISSITTNDEGEFVYDKFNEDLIVVYVEDQERGYLGYRFFSIEELNRIGYEKNSLLTLSLGNLKNMLPDLSPYILDKEKYRYYRNVGYPGGGKYLSSLILFPDFLKQEEQRLGQDFVVAIPKESQLIVVAKKNKAGIREIRNYAAASYYLKPEELLTKKLYLWNGEQLKRY